MVVILVIFCVGAIIGIILAAVLTRNTTETATGTVQHERNTNDKLLFLPLATRRFTLLFIFEG